MQIRKKFAIELEVIQGLIRLLLTTIQRTTYKLQTILTPSFHFVLIGIGGLQSTLSSFDVLLEHGRTNKTYPQKENLFSLDFDDSNSIHEDESNLLNYFVSFNWFFQSQII